MSKSKNEWISVTKSFPQDEKEVLVTYTINGKDKYVETARYYSSDNSWISDSDKYRIGNHKKEIIAWMPMPSPCEGNEKD